MILVVGSTGLVGSEVCRLLRQQGQPVRALVRATSDPAARARLASLGCELVEGDLRAAASLDRAASGVRAVISTASSTSRHGGSDNLQNVDHDGQLALVDAARRNAVTRFIFVSFRSKPGLKFYLEQAKRDVEQALAASGMNWTSLQASIFMEVWLSPILGFDAAAGRAQIFGSGDQRISFVSAYDVARFAAAALHNPATFNATIPIGGPEALSPRQVVAIFEQATGRRFDATCIPEAALRAQFEAATDPTLKSFAGLGLFNAMGDEIDMAPVLASFPTITQLTSVRDYARNFTGSGAATP